MAEEAFEAFKKEWGKRYSKSVKSGEDNWEFKCFFELPNEVRKLIYTTNIIKSFNASLRKYTRNKNVSF